MYCLSHCSGCSMRMFDDHPIATSTLPRLAEYANGFPKFNYSDIISNKPGDSSARGCSVALSRERGNLSAAANRKACNPQSRRKAAVNALKRLALDCAIPNLHPRKVAQSVVKVGPPRRCTMLSEVDAIGRSCFLTEAYAAEIEGMPTALSPIPRTKRAHASTMSTSP